MRLAVVVLFLILAAPVRAATVSVHYESLPTSGGLVIETARVRYQAGPGERNDVTVATRDGAETWRVRDTGARLTAGAYCRALDRHTARCDPPGATRAPLTAALGDGADAFRDRGAAQTAALVRASGGPGADRLTGGAAIEALDGGAGPDEIDGGDGADLLRDGPGRDVVRGGPGGNQFFSTDVAPVDDRFVGGPGLDTISYASRDEPVVATVEATGGVRGERDRLDGIEGVIGGSAPNLLRGDGGDNVLTGGSASDRLIGRGGDDTIDPGSIGFDGPETGAVDRVEAGPGRDVVALGYRSRADVHCGSGEDAAGPWSSDRSLLRPDCETYRPGNYDLPAQPAQVTADTVELTLPCFRPAFGRDATVRLVTPAGTIVAEGVIPSHTEVGSAIFTCDVRLGITAAGRALPRPAIVTTRFEFDPGWTFLLR